VVRGVGGHLVGGFVDDLAALAVHTNIMINTWY